jgi:hypothetical protein
MSVSLHDPNKPLSETLSDVANSIKGEHISLRQLLELIGEQGLLLFCMVLMIPFLLPVSIPGVSTVFSVVVIFIGIGVALNRVPWLPSRLLNHAVATENLIPALGKGANLVKWADRFIRPRMLVLTHGNTVNRFNGIMLIFAGILLIFPFGLIPFSNTLPALGVLLLAAGMLQRDGLFIVLGYVFNLLTVIYFGVLFVGALLAGQGIRSLLALSTMPLELVEVLAAF